MSKNSFGTRATFAVGGRSYEIHRLDALEKQGFSVGRLPYSLRILLENVLRNEDGVGVLADSAESIARWDPRADPSREVAFTPARVLLQDFTGVPAIVDLAAMRDAVATLGGDPSQINPLQPVELVIDHSIQVDSFGTADAFRLNEEMDYGRNGQRYAFLKWGQQAFQNFTVAPPNAGIVHQINLERLARVVFATDMEAGISGTGKPQAYPDTLVGTDSHTPMVNGLGVLGWGVGGIEAEAAMLGQSISMLVPQVIGFRIKGSLPEGATATDLVLTVTELLRKKGVVGRFVEFFGPGVGNLALADRATIGNMSPEYGATCAIFPVDSVTLDYMRFTGRSEERVRLTEAYMKEQGLFHTADSPEPKFTDVLELDLDSVEPSIAGPKRPQDRIVLGSAGAAFKKALPALLPSQPAAAGKGAATTSATGRNVGVWGEDGGDGAAPQVKLEIEGAAHHLTHGSVVIAAITSCTNTSNPSVMLAAGLLAKKAVERGLERKPWVKTSLAPGSRVVTDYYQRAGLTPYLEKLGFFLAGYGCTTCIGNSGPLPEAVSDAIQKGDLVVASVLSGNRNFEGRIHSEVRANYLMSPPLVIAFSLAGRIDIDPYNDPLGKDRDGNEVYLRDIWPSQQEIIDVMRDAIRSGMYESNYDKALAGDDRWNGMDVPGGSRFQWQEDSTYIRLPPYFEGMHREAPTSVEEIRGARAVALLGDSVTTDHISPAGSIKKDSPAGKYLVEHAVDPVDFNSYGSRRGNHEVMVRGTFANGRIRNKLAPGTEGGVTTHIPSGEVMSIYDAAMRYKQEGTPLIVLAGKEYGSGSSRDWAAKGPYLQGIRAAIAESYERIHRSNLIGMGIIPLQFKEGDSAESLGLTGHEVFDIEGLNDLISGASAGRELTVTARGEDGTVHSFNVLSRIDTPQEALYYLHGGILQYVLRRLLDGDQAPPAMGGAAGSPQPAHEQKPTSKDVEEGSKESFPASDPPAY